MTTHPTQQPEIAFLLRWFDWSAVHNRPRARVVQLLRLTDYVCFPFLFGEPYHRQAALLASWLRENAGVEFEIGAVTLEIAKPRTEEGVQWFQLVAGCVQSGSRMATGEAQEAQEAPEG